MYGYVYKTKNLINGKLYIGQHKGRFKDQKQRELISEKKKGVKRPKNTIEAQRKKIKIWHKNNTDFRSNFFIKTPYGIFDNVIQASKEINLSKDIIWNCLIKSNYVINNKSLCRSKLLSKGDIGKTYKQLGWERIPKGDR